MDMSAKHYVNSSLIQNWYEILAYGFLTMPAVVTWLHVAEYYSCLGILEFFALDYFFEPLGFLLDIILGYHDAEIAYV